MSTLEKLVKEHSSLYSIIEDIHLFMEYRCIEEDELDPDIATNLASWTEASTSLYYLFKRYLLCYETPALVINHELEYLIPSSFHYCSIILKSTKLYLGK